MVLFNAVEARTTGMLTGVGTTPEPQGQLPSPALIVHEVPAHQPWHTQDRMAANRPVTCAAGSLRAVDDAGYAADVDGCDGDAGDAGGEDDDDDDDDADDDGDYADDGVVC